MKAIGAVKPHSSQKRVLHTCVCTELSALEAGVVLQGVTARNYDESGSVGEGDSEM